MDAKFEYSSNNHQTNFEKSAQGILSEIINTVESYGSGGLWLSRSSPMISKARLACQDDHIAVAQLADLQLRFRDLLERVDTAREILARHGASFGPACQTIACLSTLRELLDTHNLDFGAAGPIIPLSTPKPNIAEEVLG